MQLCAGSSVTQPGGCAPVTMPSRPACSQAHGHYRRCPGQAGAAVLSRGGRSSERYATNADALDLNTAVRAVRVREGSVDDTRTVAGMEGVAIGAGDRIVTRRNDALAGVSNPHPQTSQDVTPSRSTKRARR